MAFTFGNSSFGATTAPATTGAFSFGAASQPAQQGNSGFNFGSAAAWPNTNNQQQQTGAGNFSLGGAASTAPASNASVFSFGGSTVSTKSVPFPPLYHQARREGIIRYFK